MKSLLVACSLAVLSAGFTPLAVEAKRLGGGSSSGMQRSLPAQTPPAALPARPAQQAAPAAPAGATAAAAAAPKRSWLGPIAGLAAGFGIAALMSHLGLGAGLANVVTILLLAAAAFFVIRLLMRKFGRGGPSLATAGGAPNAFQAPATNRGAWAGASPAPGASAFTPQPARTPFGTPVSQPAFGGGSAASVAPAAVALPPGFDRDGFERIAKMIFIRMQAANDSADLNDLRAFTTPEMFASVRLELQERGAAAQQTDVERVEAQVLEVATEGERQIVSVRFHGLIREAAGAPAEPFDEVWHLVKPTDGSREWAIAGIQQTQLA